jgi:hypothetical protein
MVEPPMVACSVVAPNGSLDLLGTLGRACSSSMYNLAVRASSVDCQRTLTPPAGYSIAVGTAHPLAGSFLGQSAVRTRGYTAASRIPLPLPLPLP